MAANKCCIDIWEDSKSYSKGKVVINSTGAMLKRKANGTSEATFDAIEADTWTLLGFLGEEVNWVGATYYYAGQKVIKADVANGVIIRRKTSGFADASWLNDIDNWEKVSQAKILEYPFNYSAATSKMENELMTNNGIIYQSNYTGQTRAGFDAIEQLQWNPITS